MPFSKEDILKALSTVEDPDLHRDLVSLNMIHDLAVEDARVSFTVVLTTPACPLQERIRKDCEEAVRRVIPANAALEIRFSSSVTSARTNATTLPDVKNIIAVASGKGGVGKSTVTANLAAALAHKGARVGLIDADIFGPSMPTMFNCEHEQPHVKEVNGKKVIIPLEQYGVKLISIGFLAPPDSAVIWRGPMASSALRQFISDVDWGSLDYLFVDLPPGTSDIHLTLVQSVPLTGAVIVTTPQKVALTDAIKALAMFRQKQINVPVLGIVENMSWFIPDDAPEKKYYIFDRDGGRLLAEKFEVPLLGQIPITEFVRESGDTGKPAVLGDSPAMASFVDLSEAFARQVAIRNDERARVPA